MRLLRLAKIWLVSLKYGLDEFLTGHERFRAVRPLARALTFWRDTSAPRAARLRQALEDLGPIFVKFGQMLSTRRDLIPLDIADELAKLQDRVPPFSSDEVMATLTRVYGKPANQVFKSFDRVPVASASVAQVHFAELPDGASPYGPDPRRHSGYDIDQARRDLGFEPSALEDALAETLAWYRVAHPSHPGYANRAKELAMAGS